MRAIPQTDPAVRLLAAIVATLGWLLIPLAVLALLAVPLSVPIAGMLGGVTLALLMLTLPFALLAAGLGLVRVGRRIGERRIEAGTCPTCGYDLRGLPLVHSCPECGALTHTRG